MKWELFIHTLDWYWVGIPHIFKFYIALEFSSRFLLILEIVLPSTAGCRPISRWPLMGHLAPQFPEHYYTILYYDSGYSASEST